MKRPESTLEGDFFEGSLGTDPFIARAYYVILTHSENAPLPHKAAAQVRKDFRALTVEEITTRLVTMKMLEGGMNNGWIVHVAALHKSRLKQLKINEKRREKRALCPANRSS